MINLIVWCGVGLSLLLFRYSVDFRHFYSHGFYLAGIRLRILLTGWFPFSIGDILYLALAGWIILGAWRLLRHLIRFRREKQYIAPLLLRLICITGLLYGVFLWGWGFNYRYNRIRDAFGIQQRYYRTADLMQLCCLLADNINASHRQLQQRDQDSIPDFPAVRSVFRQAPGYYNALSDIYPALRCPHSSIKPSMYGQLMNYAGITGYFNPFTAEAQLNTTPPPVSLPFTVCHEMAHQLGFAAEDDANFVGYLVAASAADPYFRYSANFEILPYALRELALRNSALSDSIWYKMLLPGVRKDYQTVEDFYLQFRGTANQMLNVFYDQYLKANQQEQGIKSYSEVVGLLIDYFHRRGYRQPTPSSAFWLPHSAPRAPSS
ncbi:DUF3810 domain-containing protein [Compostibacter hankyongensis]|uniref:DUF3810 domain-containing protein n=1 Tax=Compostibacter hankyongensis TaxID=1007089 RepID=UPI0031ED2C0E